MPSNPKKKRNPYRIIDKILKWIGYSIMGLLVGSFAGIIIMAAWKGGMGAWALALPVLIVLGVAALVLVLYLISIPFAWFGKKWREWRRDWDRKSRGW